ncbi:MAG: TonB-dependent receptor, partial [Deltaproteobacteria bacterium]|nr:TonB-dependent receptor [Deltaproteobacteria bacterium]
RSVARARPWALGPATLRLEGGLDSYLDLVQSTATVGFTDLGVTRALSRGQYVAGSTSLTGGAFLEGHLAASARLHLRAGGRVGWASLSSPGDAASGSAPVRGLWWPLAGHAGVEWGALGPLTLLASVDHSFRAPNLDDLTSRQQTGPGFQFENPALAPERATTVEAGLRLRHEWVTAEAWAFQTWLAGAVGKQPRDIGDCPPSTPQCAASWFRFQLVNAPGLADLRGGELVVRVRLPAGLGVRGAASYAWGEGPSLAGTGARVPLSRVPPPHGFLEASWRSGSRVGAAAVLRWAGEQRRLAVADLSDPRIPAGGTPGFALMDLRAWLRLSGLFVSLVVENVFDTPWRAHGSSVNGPGRGVLLSLGVGQPVPDAER